MAEIEIEKKYIIEMPDVSDMRACADYTLSRITQTYLDCLPGITHRVRMREYDNGRVEFTETVKRRIDRMSSYEDEREITSAEYEALLEKIKRGTKSLYKLRHTFVYFSQLFEIDVYPEWKNTCIMETELRAEDATVEMPPFIRIIEDVTGQREYSNAAMSASFPEEKKLG